LESFADAARDVDGKWDRAFAKADQLRAGFRLLLGDPHGEYALGASTHDLVLRFLSAMELPRRPRLVTTDGEFHTLRRQLARLEEEGVEIVRVPLDPVTTLAERVAGEVDGNTAAVLVSAVLFETSRLVPGLAHLADVCRGRSIELVVDAYHALGVVPFALHDLGLTNAWVLGGGYKYLQLGEGNCFLRLPPHAETARPVITGWFAEFAELFDPHRPEVVSYGPPETRFASGTYDPASNYRAARVMDFFVAHGHTPALLREVALHKVGVLRTAFDALDLPDAVVTRDRNAAPQTIAGFLSLRAPEARQLQRVLAERGVLTDSRADILRLGPAPYLTDQQLVDAVATLGEIATVVH
jgi:selenocysteine lyase/cysteine desulfurase